VLAEPESLNFSREISPALFEIILLKYPGKSNSIIFVHLSVAKAITHVASVVRKWNNDGIE